MKQNLTEEEYRKLILPYEECLDNVERRIEILNNDYKLTWNREPVHHIQKRIKSRQSIEEKIVKKGGEATIEDIQNLLRDIAGIRVICYDKDEIGNLANQLKKQKDLVIIKERDYISEPKSNGYRSYHLVVGVPFYRVEEMEYFPVEIQMRTMAMDMWASLEHRNCYKKKDEEKKAWEKKFLKYAKILNQIEEEIAFSSD